MEEIIYRLDAASVRKTNLHRMADTLEEERANPALSRFRRMEAQLGYSPGEVHEHVIDDAIDFSSVFGEDAWGELAVASWRDPQQLLAADDIRSMARIVGFDVSLRDMASSASVY